MKTLWDWMKTLWDWMRAQIAALTEDASLILTPSPCLAAHKLVALVPGDVTTLFWPLWHIHSSIHCPLNTHTHTRTHTRTHTLNIFKKTSVTIRLLMVAGIRWIRCVLSFSITGITNIHFRGSGFLITVFHAGSEIAVATQHTSSSFFFLTESFWASDDLAQTQ